MIRRSIARLLVVVATAFAALFATGTASQAAGIEWTLSVSAPNYGPICQVRVTSNQTFNQPGSKKFHLWNTSSAWPCRLELYTQRTSTAHNVYSVRMSRDLIFVDIKIHRIRICQDYRPGGCSHFLWWTGDLHTS
jgi:hypothetical protein